MRSFLFFLFFFPLTSTGQYHEYAEAYRESIPDSLGQPVRLPGPQYREGIPDLLIADYALKQRVFVISSDAVYRAVFWNYRFTKDSVEKYAPDKDSWHHQWLVYHLSDSIPAIDFSKQELLMYSACAQCLTYCRHEEVGSCHRNACDFSYSWFLRDKDRRMENATGSKRNFLNELYGFPPSAGAKLIRLETSWKFREGQLLKTGNFSSYLYVVDTDSLYQLICKEGYQYRSEAMPVFDFSKQELLVRMVCHRCLLYCANQNDWKNTACHKGPCQYNYTWYVRNKGSAGDQTPEFGNKYSPVDHPGAKTF